MAILGITLLLAFVYGVISGATPRGALVTNGGAGLLPAPLFRMVADVLFFEGGLVLTFGALIEFFFRARSYTLARCLLLPYSLTGRALPEEKRSGGWMLIFSGALLLAASVAFAVIELK